MLPLRGAEGPRRAVPRHEPSVTQCFKNACKTPCLCRSRFECRLPHGSDLLPANVPVAGNMSPGNISAAWSAAHKAVGC